MKRAIILLLDSFGVGGLPDAKQFGDEGANTLRHIAEVCEKGQANQEEVRQGPLHLPNMTRLGLNALAKDCNGSFIPGLSTKKGFQSKYGYANELGINKDTLSGHWEITGVPVTVEWGFFPDTYPAFPAELTETFIKQSNLPGILGNKHASGTEIIKELGEEHVRSGKPILYTSADSVLQIAAHEETFGLERLYEICEIARQLVNRYHVGRVIARPFNGEKGEYKRTPNRHDYATPPPSPTLLDKLIESGGEVISIGKIDDIFAHRGISKKVKASGNMHLFDKTLEEIKTAGDRTLLFTNFVDFDMEYGHRRNVMGYAHALEEFDARIPEVEALLQPNDIVILTADHGCDPTYTGTDHTREYIPIMVFGKNIQPENIGERKTFADIGESLAHYFGLSSFGVGRSFLL